MKVYEAKCVKSWSITAQNGDHFELEQGKNYTIGAPAVDQTVMVFSRFWLRVPMNCFEPVAP